MIDVAMDADEGCEGFAAKARGDLQRAGVLNADVTDSWPGNSQRILVIRIIVGGGGGYPGGGYPYHQEGGGVVAPGAAKMAWTAAEDKAKRPLGCAASKRSAVSTKKEGKR